MLSLPKTGAAKKKGDCLKPSISLFRIFIKFCLSLCLALKRPFKIRKKKKKMKVKSNTSIRGCSNKTLSNLFNRMNLKSVITKSQQ